MCRVIGKKANFMYKQWSYTVVALAFRLTTATVKLNGKWQSAYDRLFS